MATIWHPQENKVLLSWLEAIENEALDKLNEWETNFITDIGYKIRKGWNLTQRQEEILEKIYCDKTS